MQNDEQWCFFEVDDRLFTGEISIALYLLPAFFAGIGVNLLSHVRIDYVSKVEHKFRNGRAGS